MAGQKPGGVNFYFGPDGTVEETHTSTCAHCQAVTGFPSLKTMTDHVDICRGCMRLICLSCVGKPCVVFERQAEMIERQHRKRQLWADMGIG